MTTYLGKSCSFGLPRVLFVNCRQFMYLVISLLVLRAGCGIWLYQFLIIAYLFTLRLRTVWPYLVNVANKEYCSICLETVFISEECCINILVVVVAAEESRVWIYSKGTLSKTALSRYVSISKHRTSVWAIEQQSIVYFILESTSIFAERKPASWFAELL